MPRGLRRTPIRASDADRAKALAQVDAMAAQGLIRGGDELKARREQISRALYASEIQAALVNLPQTLKQTDLPASDTDREQAIRQIRLHESVGHLTSEEADSRIKIIPTCRTRESIAAVLSDLPDIGQREAPRRISQRDRDDALKQIDRALLDERITASEHALASAQIKQARTRQELNVAFRGLTNPAVAAARYRAADAGRAAVDVSGRVVEGGRRVLIAFLRWVVAVVVAVIGIVLLIVGNHLVGGIVLAVGVLIWLSSFVALFTSRRR